MHRKLTTETDEPGISPDSPIIEGAAPEIDVDTTGYGYRYFGVRPMGEDRTYVRGYHCVMPFTQLRPSGSGRSVVDGHFGFPWMITTLWSTTGATAAAPARFRE